MSENQTLLDKAKEYADKNHRNGNHSSLYDGYTAGYLAGAGENNRLKWREVIKKRLIHFASIYHIHEAKRLDDALIAIKELIPPEQFDESSPVNEQREKEVEGLRAKVEFYRTATDKVRELVSNSPDIGAPCQPLYDAIVDKLNENNSKIKELEEALRQIYLRPYPGGETEAPYWVDAAISIAQQALKQPQ